MSTLSEIEADIDTSHPSQSSLRADSTRALLKRIASAILGATATEDDITDLTNQIISQTYDMDALDARVDAVEALNVQTTINISALEFNSLNGTQKLAITVPPAKHAIIHSAILECVTAPGISINTPITFVLCANSTYDANKVLMKTIGAIALTPGAGDAFYFGINDASHKVPYGTNIYLGASANPTDWSGTWQLHINYTLI